MEEKAHCKNNEIIIDSDKKDKIFNKLFTISEKTKYPYTYGLKYKVTETGKWPNNYIRDIFK